MDLVHYPIVWSFQIQVALIPYTCATSSCYTYICFVPFSVCLMHIFSFCVSLLLQIPFLPRSRFPRSTRLWIQQDSLMRTATKPSLLWASFQPSSPLSRQHSTKPMYVCVVCMWREGQIVEGGAGRVVM